MLQFAVLLVSLNDEDRFFIESLYRRYIKFIIKTEKFMKKAFLSVILVSSSINPQV